MNPVEIIGFLGQIYEGAYYYSEQLRKALHAATIGKRDMVCLNNGCWIEASYNIPDDWIQWKYLADTHELVNIHGPRETEPLGWLSVFYNAEDISSFFASLRCGKSEDTKYFPTDSMLISLFALQNGFMPKGSLSIILADASEKILDCGSLFTVPVPDPATTTTQVTFSEFELEQEQELEVTEDDAD